MPGPGSDGLASAAEALARLAAAARAGGLDDTAALIALAAAQTAQKRHADLARRHPTHMRHLNAAHDHGGNPAIVTVIDSWRPVLDGGDPAPAGRLLP